jgi:hypothetical protein
MLYAKIVNNTFETFIPNIPTQWDENHFQTPESLTDYDRLVFHIRPVVEVDKPGYDEVAQSIRCIKAIQIGGEWQQLWEVVALPQPAIIENNIAKAEKDLKTALDAGFTHNSIPWHSDSIFQSQLQGYVLAFTTGILQSDAKVKIRDLDNNTHELSNVEVLALSGALLQYVQAQYVTYWSVKDAQPKVYVAPTSGVWPI